MSNPNASTSTRALTYLTNRTKQHYDLDGTPEARTGRVAVQFSGSDLIVYDLEQHTSDTYAFIASEPYLDDAVHFFQWTSGDGWGGYGAEVVQMAVVGATQAGDFAFLRVFDALGKELPAYNPLSEILYSRGWRLRGPEYAFEGELVLEAGKATNMNPPDAAEGAVPGTIPGISFHSQRGATFYSRQPSTEYDVVGHLIKLTWNEQVLTYDSEEASEIYRRLPFETQQFLEGTLRYYFFFDNPDPGDYVGVWRVAVLGIKANGEFGFMRVFDSLGGDFPPESLFPLPFDFFTSHDPDTYGRFNQEMVVEMGSPVALEEQELIELIPDEKEAQVRA